MSSSPQPPEPNFKFKNEAHRTAAMATMTSLKQVASPAQLTYLSNRPLAEVEALQQEVAAVVPAGNIVGLVMSGLMRLRDRSLPVSQAKSDVSALLRGIEVLPRSLLSNPLYGTFFAGPATVLAAYQKLLTLTGKNLDTAFPNGLWQFYLEFAMREDSARHANETVGFQKALVEYNLNLSEINQLSAWVCAVSQICFQYDELLHNEWREQTYLNLLEAAAESANLSHKLHFQRLWRAWTTQRPYRRGQDASPSEDYITYRRRRFDNFLHSRAKFLPTAQRVQLNETYNQRLEAELAGYQEQMTILATLDPERYRENRTPLPLWQTRVGIIHQGCYYLLPICHTDQAGRPLLFSSQTPEAHISILHPDPNGNLSDPQGRLLKVDRMGQIYDAETGHLQGYLRPAQFQAIRRQVIAIFQQPPQPTPNLPALDEQLVMIRRVEQERARKTLKQEAVQRELQALKYAPVLLNWDEHPHSLPLAYIRRGQRGIGDHALTIFRTPKSMVFDQSHIFFDGVWGIALSEILTGEAISWAAYFSNLESPEPAAETPYKLQLNYEAALEKFSQLVTVEVSAESTNINTKMLYTLLKLFPQRRQDLKLTVNDLLILYRCEFGPEYKPSSDIENALFELQAQGTVEAQEVYRLINEVLVRFQLGNPSLMIPMNATAAKPHERLYPTTFRNPFSDLWVSYQNAAKNLSHYMINETAWQWTIFSEARSSLLAKLDYFSQLLRAYKKVALAGGSPSTATLKLMAHVPSALLEFLHEIPQRIDILNEVIKGEEVFSNVGRVARGTSLSRFISAKDDHENKGLVWGFLTDDSDTLHISLRDFRPYVAALHPLGQIDLAEMIVQDYLRAFTVGFNQFVASLHDILNASATHAVRELE